MVTQEDVAKKAGVSFITVSRVLNNKGYVKVETRAKVLKTIEELNYYTNHVGQALRNKKIKTIGIIIPEPPDLPVHGMEFYNLILQGIDRSSMAHGYDILLSICRQNDIKVDYLRLFYQRKADGLIFFIPDLRHLNLFEIVKNKIPCVIISEKPEMEGINYVDSDNYEGMFKVTEHLISKNLKKIAFIKGKSFMQNSKDRYNGFLNAMEKNNLPVIEKYIFEGDFSRNSGVEIMKEIIKMNDLPDAIVCCNDHMALGVISEAKKNKIKIPEDISVVGFDDINITEFTDPSLTTVRQHLFDMGFTATEMLFKKLKDPDIIIENKIFPVELILRKSTLT